MAIKLNLLPPEKAVSAPVGKILKATRRINLILVSLFIVFVLAVGGFFIYLTIQLGNYNSSVENLKEELKSRQTSEQQIILVKDRLGKIKQAKNSPNVYDKVVAVEELLAFLGSDSSLTELDLTTQKIEMSVLFRSNSSLKSFFDLLKLSGGFKSVVLTSFGYNPASGYLVAFNLTQ